MSYFIIGILWCAFLEWYTTNKVDGFMGRPWVMRERLVHFILWHISLGTFIWEILKQITK